MASTEQDVPFPAGCADGRHVHPQTGAVLHGGERDQPCPGPQRIDDRLFRSGRIQAHGNHLDTLIRQRFPGNTVGRELLIADHDLVTGLPINALGNH